MKSHAVTMFEVGKLSDESLDSFLSELEKVGNCVILITVSLTTTCEKNQNMTWRQTYKSFLKFNKSIKIVNHSVRLFDMVWKQANHIW